MILPIVAYGDPVLKKQTSPVARTYPHLDTLLDNMFETMYNAYGVGLAAPQVGVSIRLFIVDAAPFADTETLTADEREHLKVFKEVFINPQIQEETGTAWRFNEGCLSIPDIREDVSRKQTIRISYLDQNFKQKERTFDGLLARVIQHEYDHIEGILFTDKLSTLKKRLLKGKLSNISKGLIKVDYAMRFPNKKKKR